MNINEKQINAFIDLTRIRNDELMLQRIPLNAEHALIQQIKSGDYQNIKIHSFSKMEDNMGIKPFNALLHFQFTTVAAITLFSRAAIEAGADPDEVFDASDVLLHYLSKAETPDDCHQLFELSAILYAKKVNKVKNQNMPYHIRKICTYISRNIFHKITIEEIAEYAELSPNYMCNMFSSHMNITLHNYIQREKVQIACNFLSQTKTSIMEISTYLGFKTASNFSIIFKKWMGISPTEYRNREFKEVY